MERGFDVPIRFLCPPEICVLELRLPVGRKAKLALANDDVPEELKCV